MIRWMRLRIVRARRARRMVTVWGCIAMLSWAAPSLLAQQAPPTPVQSALAPMPSALPLAPAPAPPVLPFQPPPPPVADVPIPAAYAPAAVSFVPHDTAPAPSDPSPAASPAPATSAQMDTLISLQTAAAQYDQNIQVDARTTKAEVAALAGFVIFFGFILTYILRSKGI